MRDRGSTLLLFGFASAGVACKLITSGITYGINNAGELVGFYVPNYILSASRPAQMRRNMAFVTMLMAPAAPTSYLFGAISDYIREHDITALGVSSSKAFGFQASFALCAAMMACGVVIALFLLPAQPSALASDSSESGPS
jgi:hypothetical protein